MGTQRQHTGPRRRSVRLGTIRSHHLGSIACKRSACSPVRQSGRRAAPLTTASATALSRPRCTAWCSNSPRPSSRGPKPPLVPTGRKHRGFCHSCGAQRMAQAAAHLVPSRTRAALREGKRDGAGPKSAQHLPVAPDLGPLEPVRQGIGVGSPPGRLAQEDELAFDGAPPKGALPEVEAIGRAFGL